MGITYDDDSRVALNPRLFTKPWPLTPRGDRKFPFGQCGRRPGVGTPSNIRSTLPVSCFVAKESVIAGSGYNRWKVPPASISTHAAGSHGATLSTVPGQMKSYHKRGVVRSNLQERHECFGYDLPLRTETLWEQQLF